MPCHTGYGYLHHKNSAAMAQRVTFGLSTLVLVTGWMDCKYQNQKY